MFHPRTVFVVGAGASKEAGLPIGRELASTIASLLYFEFERGSLKRGDHEFLEVLKTACAPGKNVNDYLKLCRQMSEGIYLSESIDNYIDKHQDDLVSTCGKLAIAYSIVAAERRSLLYLNPREARSHISFKNLENSWYDGFAKIAFDGVRKSAIDNVFDDIAVISFNYDRCLPHYLSHALSATYSIDPSKAAEIVSSLSIQYPYGRIGPLTSMQRAEVVSFGAELQTGRLVDVARNIRTYTEQLDDTSTLEEIKAKMASADSIVFLGFAYHHQNLSLLSPHSRVKSPRIFGTALGFSQPDTYVISRQLHKSFLNGALSDRSIRAHVQMRNDLTCFQLIGEYRRSLAK